MDDFEDIMDNIFYGHKVNEDAFRDAFRDALRKILSNIAKVRKTPTKQREFENWR